MKKILLLEDDPTLGHSLRDRLSQEYEVCWAKSLAEARNYLKKQIADLAILDLGLPDGSGFDIAEEIHRNTPHTLFLFLTAQADADSRLKGFEIGAQEFIPKPFFLKELLLRVKHVLDVHAPKQEIQLEHCLIRLHDFSVLHKNGSIDYPPVNDMKVLKLLVERAPQAVNRDEIMNHIWGNDALSNQRTIDNMIVRLRNLVSDESKIRSVRGIGYQWVQEKDNE